MNMDKYKYKSGAQKRKEKNMKEKKAPEGKQTLQNLNFFVSDKKQITIETEINPGEEVNVTEITDEEITIKDMRSASASESVTVTQSTSCCSTEKIIDSTPDSTKKLFNIDIGNLRTILGSVEIEDAVVRGSEQYPSSFPVDKDGIKFPTSILRYRLKNNEIVDRDWLVWSSIKQALFCFPCRLFSKLSVPHRSVFTSEVGWGVSKGYRKLYNKIPDHENSINHRNCYVEWRNLENTLNKKTTIDSLIWKQIDNEKQVWKKLLQRFLDVILFLAERGLAFRGTSHLIGHPRNGNFLGILEVISHYDSLLEEHLRKVKEAQKGKKRLQVHYLSADIQNEFISCCAEYVMNTILKERESAKYFSIIVDATPDTSHTEQTTFIMRYVCVNKETNKYEILERFLEFVNCNKKTGKDISDLILKTLQKRNISISDCRGQGYDNASNMSGAYKGTQSRILEINPLAIFSPCACHSLNLCGVHAAECCPEIITFFGIIQKLYNIFSSSPQRWEILKENIGVSLHTMSNTRWSARVESVKPVAEKLPGIQKAIESVLQLHLTPDVRIDLQSMSTYMDSFECVLLSTLWLKILTAINYRSSILQARDTTIDAEVKNLETLLQDLTTMRNNWETILNESKLIAENFGTQIEFKNSAETRQRKRKKFSEDTGTEDSFSNLNPAELFQYKVFNVLLDTLIANMNRRFNAIKEINLLFEILWKFPTEIEKEIKEKCQYLQTKYQNDISLEICDELIHLKNIYYSNFGENSLTPIEFLNELKKFKLEPLFPNVIIALRIFCTIPVTVAQGERSFSCLSRIKDVLRSTMCQNRLSNLGLLSIEAELAKKCDFSAIIDLFANSKSRKALI